MGNHAFFVSTAQLIDLYEKKGKQKFEKKNLKFF